jgi:hypothetical protein
MLTRYRLELFAKYQFSSTKGAKRRVAPIDNPAVALKA